MILFINNNLTKWSVAFQKTESVLLNDKNIVYPVWYPHFSSFRTIRYHFQLAEVSWDFFHSFFNLKLYKTALSVLHSLEIYNLRLVFLESLDFRAIKSLLEFHHSKLKPLSLY